MSIREHDVSTNPFRGRGCIVALYLWKVFQVVQIFMSPCGSFILFQLFKVDKIEMNTVNLINFMFVQ